MKKREIALLAILLAFDLASKSVIEASMQLGDSIPVIPGFFNITYAVNKGAAWSILEGEMIFFYIITTVAIGFISWMFIKTKKHHTFTRISLICMLAGTVGNFYDRIVYQHVRDFLDFIIFGYDFPIFNIADSVLCIGVFILFLVILFNKEEANELL